MDNNLSKYKKEVVKVFGIGVDILNTSRSLRTISQDLKLLAINGIVQAAKIGNNQGQSLITLSSFLSDLPGQIAPELLELEEFSSKLAYKITICSLAVKRFMQYSQTLEIIFGSILETKDKNKSKIEVNLLKSKELMKIKNNKLLDNVAEPLKGNIISLAKKNVLLLEEINELFAEIQSSMQKAVNMTERVRRNGFIANYMGSNISIESAYLSRGQQNFDSLVASIKKIVEMLNEKLDIILNDLNDVAKSIDNLIKSGK